MSDTVSADIVSKHPKGPRARVLLSAVFGPYARDDEFGSRAINPMELYHNQVTRVQGIFSLRRFHHSWGLRFIQENIQAPCTTLDFPTREAFIRELGSHEYDIVGISSIVSNVNKVKEMCRLTREISPQSTIVVGGHVAAIPGLDGIIDADHIVRGEGVAWLRTYLGEDSRAPFQHPGLATGYDLRVMGVKLPNRYDNSAAVIASAGCAMGCNFCSTSAFFGGKGKVINFYNTGEELFRVMEQAETARGSKGFSIMDENFLLQKRRAMELLELMKKHRKSWSLNIFASANAIRQFSYEELVELGISSLWLGLESPKANYPKLAGADTIEVSHELRERGILVLGSSIIGLEHHTPQNIDEEIEHAVAHENDLHQFMLYTPLPGTPLYREMEREDRLLNIDLADIHGQYAFNFEHKAITRDDSTTFLLRAFERDFERNGPSIFRMCRTTLAGWRRYKNHPNPRIRERYTRSSILLRHLYPAALWVIERKMKNSNPKISEQAGELRGLLEHEFGPLTVAAVRALGPIFAWTSRREENRLAGGWTYEPRTLVYRRNWDSREHSS